MDRTLSRQRGLTFFRLLLTCATIGIIALIGMRLFPLFNESLKVSSAMESIAGRADISKKSSREITTLILRNFEVSDVDQFTEANIQKHLKISRDEGGKSRTMNMAYESRVPLFGNLDLILNYNHSVTLQGSGLE
jgi:hypothetical protein